eukprot:TRINITY_DN8851_c0_g1_i1.p1 TRINITY_DN8851_c0_g1~~TRINITY_DN8851_c0_g1_i1.p1  ORF type:complete len:437 (-),score=80.25 TRINITY_DN8851_c0_g1_i1:82-1392(-)
MSLLSQSPAQFIELLKKNGTRRAYFVYDPTTKKIKPSAPYLQEIAEFFEKDTRDFLEHQAFFLEIGEQSQELLGAFVHKTNRGQAAGGVRYWPYKDLESYLRDGLRLAVGMGRKNALAGLWWGGGKGVIARHSDNWKERSFRDVLYQEYGQFLTSLQGCYVSAEDAGTTPEDVKQIFKTTRFITCIPESLGGSGNPSIATAKGIVCGMEAALNFLGLGNLEGKSIAIQGAGNVAFYLIGNLLAKNVKSIVASDVNSDRRDFVAKYYEKHSDILKVELVGENTNEILSREVDIVSPCALGGTLNSQTIPTIKAKIICGAANNQLLNDRTDDKLINEKGIVYCPDFIVNRMGIVYCANEQYGYVNNDSSLEHHLTTESPTGIYSRILEVLKYARKENITTTTAANKMADEASLSPHPIWGNRSQKIIDSLVENHWETK